VGSEDEQSPAEGSRGAEVRDEQEQIASRRAKLAELRRAGEAYPNDFRPSATAAALHVAYEHEESESLESKAVRVRVAGRMMTRRVMGRASFAHLQDRSGRIQLYVRRDELDGDRYDAFKRWDLGDIVGAEGVLFKTRTGELSVRVDDARLLVKALRPPPEKFHGLADQETRYRQRYLDLIANERSRRTFLVRSQVVERVRQFLRERDFLEVETPMMQPIPGGALARPFVTYHNALDLELYLRIAPELYLKRLVVGGFERVFEINRNFRNEGVSAQHNPEFTMLEFYQAYADYRDFMDLSEALMRDLARSVHGRLELEYQGRRYDLAPPFRRMTLKEAILAHNPALEPGELEDLERARAAAEHLGVPVEPDFGLGKVLVEMFEKTVEPRLETPTFITHYPTEVSPLSRASAEDPSMTDRFELFIAGLEVANGFSELNDPEEQAARFREQARRRGAGDEEAMYFDEDYVRALEYGLPPTAGEGVGVDRLVMLLADQPSIRDVLLFPHLRPRASAG